MTRNRTFTERNLELKLRWQELLEKPDQSDRAVESAKRQLADDVIEANRRMIGAEIRKYTGRSPQLEPDLFATAGAELWRAFQMWDPDKGTLRTCAMPYISGAVRREVARHDHPHLTYDDFTLRNTVLNVQRAFEREHNRPPTVTELAELSEVPPDKVAVLFAGSPVSLDAPLDSGTDDGSTLGDVISEQPGESAQDAQILLAELQTALEPEVAEKLEAEVLIAYLMRQPAPAGAPATTSEVAYMLGSADLGREIPSQVTHASLVNAHVKLRRLTGEEPTAEQLSLLSNVPRKRAEQYLNAG